MRLSSFTPYASPVLFDTKHRLLLNGRCCCSSSTDEVCPSKLLSPCCECVSGLCQWGNLCGWLQVCMLTCFPKLLYNFIYRGFSIRDVLDNPAEAARWLAARDLTIAATFCR